MTDRQQRRDDPAKLSEKLRRQMIEALRLDPTKLTLGDEVIIGRAGVLRLMLSDLEAAALAGKPVDAGKFCEVSEMYERLLRHQHAAVTADGTSALDAARRRMAEILCIDLDSDSDLDTRQSYWEARIAELEAEVERLKGELALSSLSPQQQPLPANVVPIVETSAQKQAKIDALNATPPPRHYLQQHKDAWRDYVSPTGEIRTGSSYSREYWGPI
jgi:hypothetical protein